jgi:hypothetical protein
VRVNLGSITLGISTEDFEGSTEVGVRQTCVIALPVARNVRRCSDVACLSRVTRRLWDQGTFPLLPACPPARLPAAVTVALVHALPSLQILERKAPPTFPIVVEIRARNFYVAHWVEDSVDQLLLGRIPVVQVGRGGRAGSGGDDHDLAPLLCREVH